MNRPNVPSAGSQPQYLQRFIVKLDSRVFAVPVDQVDWIESAANYVRLHVGTTSYLLRATMASVESSLDPRQFMRVHRNAIVNLSCVQGYHMPARGSMNVLLRSGSRVPLSRGYQAAVRKMLHNQAGGANRSFATSGSTDYPIS